MTCIISRRPRNSPPRFALDSPSLFRAEHLPARWSNASLATECGLCLGISPAIRTHFHLSFPLRTFVFCPFLCESNSWNRRLMTINNVSENSFTAPSIELSKYVARVFVARIETVQWWFAVPMTSSHWERIRCHSYSYRGSYRRWFRSVEIRTNWTNFVNDYIKMGIFNRKIGLKYPLAWSEMMFGPDLNDRQTKMPAIPTNNTKSAPRPLDEQQRNSNSLYHPKYTIQKRKLSTNDADTNLNYLFRPKRTIQKQTLSTKILNSRGTMTRPGWSGAPNDKSCLNCDATANDTESERASDNLLLSNIQESLSSINLHQSDIESHLWRLMIRPTSHNVSGTLTENGGGRVKVSPHRIGYINEVQQQSIDGCQCCYHEANRHYDHDSLQLPGKLLNFIVLMAIFLHYAIIVFIEPNYFDWSFVFVLSFLVHRRIDAVSRYT